ncbi:MAG: 3'-5' exonuclease [Saprospiraceae bacterium]
MNYIIFDLEATCWLGRPPHGINEVIEIGAVKVNRYGEVDSIFSKFVKPSVNPILSDFCKKLTSIQQQDVDKSKKFPVICQEFMDWIGIEEEFCLVSWGKYDKEQLALECNLHKMESEWLQNHCNAKIVYKNFKKEATEQGLKKVIKNEGFIFTGVHHRAISDAENLAKVFIKYFEEWGI